MRDDADILGPDGYDVEEVLGDLEGSVPREVATMGARKIVEQAQKQRLSPPSFEVEPSDTATLGELVDHSVLEQLFSGVADGGDSDSGVPFSPVASPDFPIVQTLYRKFLAATPPPRTVRVDTAASYALWVADRDRSSIVPLSLPPWAKDAIDCWCEDDNVVCSVKLPGAVVTASTPASRHVDDAMGYASDAGVDPVEVMDVLPTLGQILGGGSLVTQICRAAPLILQQPDVRAGKVTYLKVTPQCDAAVAAVMALVQFCERGAKKACDEAERLQKAAGGAELVTKAKACLARARGAR